MSASHFTEGDLLFHFPTDWGVRKYDQQRFYRHMGGMGLKGVDFLVIDPEGGGHLYLIEVKNYRTRYREGMIFEAPLKEQEELANIVATKYEHTMRAIRAIHLYYLRKWWYQLTRRFFRDSRRLSFDPVFWTRAYELARISERHTALLWMETEAPSVAYRKQLTMELGERLRAGVQFSIAEQDRPFPVGIRVEDAGLDK